MLNWLKTQKKWLIPTGVAAILVSLLFSITLYVQHRRQRQLNDSPIEKAEGRSSMQTQGQDTTPDKPGPAATGNHREVSDLPPRMIPEDRMSAFSREPSPAEVTRKLETMEANQQKEEEKKLTDLQVIWPLYFFSLTKHGQDTVRLMLDASENGFGVIIVTEINLKKYPVIATAQPGDKIWLAGKIAGIDTHGTGQITLVAEYVGLAGNEK